MNQEAHYKYHRFSFVMNGRRFNYSLWGNNYQMLFNWAIQLAQLEISRES